MKPVGRQVRDGLLHSSLGGTERRSGPFPIFNAVTVKFITLKAVLVFAGARTVATAAALGNIEGSRGQPALPVRGGCSSRRGAEDKNIPFPGRRRLPELSL